MRWEGIRADDICAQLVSRLRAINPSVSFPGFVQHNQSSDCVLTFLKSSAPARSNSFDKFDFVEWVALELSKRASFMSAPTLAVLLNELGYRTNWNLEFKGTRGIYRLISGTYHRLERAGKSDRAILVAEAFRKPNFEYAYKC